MGELLGSFSVTYNTSCIFFLINFNRERRNDNGKCINAIGLGAEDRVRIMETGECTASKVKLLEENIAIKFGGQLVLYFRM